MQVSFFAEMRFSSSLYLVLVIHLYDFEDGRGKEKAHIPEGRAPDVMNSPFFVDDEDQASFVKCPSEAVTPSELTSRSQSLILMKTVSLRNRNHRSTIA